MTSRRQLSGRWTKTSNAVPVAMKIRIRTASKPDISKLARIEIEAAKLFPAGRVPDMDSVTPLEDLIEAMEDQTLWVAEEGDQPVGFALAFREGDELHLEEMDVLPTHGRRGLGTELLMAVVAHARELKLQSVTLTTFADMPWNAPFYERAGFRVLQPEELGQRLARILEDESARGRTNRVGMRRSVEKPRH